MGAGRGGIGVAAALRLTSFGPLLLGLSCAGIFYPSLSADRWPPPVARSFFKMRKMTRLLGCLASLRIPPFRICAHRTKRIGHAVPVAE